MRHAHKLTVSRAIAALKTARARIDPARVDRTAWESLNKAIKLLETVTTKQPGPQHTGPGL